MDMPATTDASDHFTRPTTAYWQELLPASSELPRAPYRYEYPVRLRDGRILLLPLRRLPDGTHAVASLIANQASFAVVDGLAQDMAALARGADAQIIVGMPTLGLAFAPLVAERLGHARYLPLGYSRKFWYDDALSEPVASITTPSAGKRLYIDPNLMGLLDGRRVCLVDDAVSSGTSILAAFRLLARAGVSLSSVIVAMKQTTRWQDPLAAEDAKLPGQVHAVFGCPLFCRVEDGWMPVADSLPAVP